MNDMGRIDPMYQFSLDAYIELFNNSIDKSLKHPKLDERINFLNDYHTFAVYQYVICSVTVSYLESCFTLYLWFLIKQKPLDCYCLPPYLA